MIAELFGTLEAPDGRTPQAKPMDFCGRPDCAAGMGGRAEP